MIFYGPEEAPEAKELGQKGHGASTRVKGAPPPRVGVKTGGSWVAGPELCV